MHGGMRNAYMNLVGKL